MTAHTALETPAAERARLGFVKALREAREASRPDPLAEAVRANLRTAHVGARGPQGRHHPEPQARVDPHPEAVRGAARERAPRCAPTAIAWWGTP